MEYTPEGDDVVELLNFVPKPKEFIEISDEKEDSLPPAKKAKQEGGFGQLRINIPSVSKLFSFHELHDSHKKVKHGEPSIACKCCDTKFLSAALRNAHYYKKHVAKKEERKRKIQIMRLTIETHKKVIANLEQALSINDREKSVLVEDLKSNTASLSKVERNFASLMALNENQASTIRSQKQAITTAKKNLHLKLTCISAISAASLQELEHCVAHETDNSKADNNTQFAGAIAAALNPNEFANDPFARCSEATVSLQGNKPFLSNQQDELLYNSDEEPE